MKSRNTEMSVAHVPDVARDSLGIEVSVKLTKARDRIGIVFVPQMYLSAKLFFIFPFLISPIFVDKESFP